MALTQQTDIQIALEILLEETEGEISRINHLGAQAFDAGDYASVDEIRTQAQQLRSFREKVTALAQEWEQLQQALGLSLEPSATRVTERRYLGRAPQGQMTPREEYRIPLLQVLEENNGSAPAVEILKQLERKLADRLNEIDYEILPSAPNEPRWRKNANWIRFELVREGLMRKDSRRGIWEISEAGRRYLKSHQQ